ncbi:MAG: hypothetical protein ACO37W_15700 [Prochlorotrichaceae cyanobacterium]
MSFEETIAFSQTWLRDVAQGKRSEAQILTDLKDVFQSVEGVRGFFVVFLSEDTALGETVPEAFLQAFEDNAAQIAAVLVKNVAMSTAMMIHHDRQGNALNKAGSLQVQNRSVKLLRLLHQRGVQTFDQERSSLLASLETGKGAYATFLDRWGYDQSQRQAIQTILAKVSET